MTLINPKIILKLSLSINYDRVDTVWSVKFEVVPSGRSNFSISFRNFPILASSAASLTLPAAIWFNDCCFSLSRVRGSSMEPALLDGDVILVRRTEFLPWRKLRNDEKMIRGTINNSLHGDGGDDGVKDDGGEEGNPKEEAVRNATERQRVRKVDGSWEWHGHNSILFSPAPLILSGDVAVFCSPSSYPARQSVKRVIATGRQRVRPAGNLRPIESVAADCLWVEGDFEKESEDSRTYGPVSKRLLVGRAERIIWPPSRRGYVEKKETTSGRWWSIDFDDDD